MYDIVSRKNTERFLTDVAMLDWGYKLNPIAERYLTNADLSELENILIENDNPVIVCKSPHESAKTTALFPDPEGICLTLAGQIGFDIRIFQ